MNLKDLKYLSLKFGRVPCQFFVLFYNNDYHEWTNEQENCIHEMQSPAAVTNSL